MPTSKGKKKKKRPFEVFNYFIGSILKGNGQKNHVNNIKEI